jgi:septal ring factor EnvC (AmiA/AmiB activator)
VEACLSFDPDQRQTPAGLAHALRLVQASLPETAGHEAALLSVVAAQQTDNEGLRRDITVIRQELGAVRQERDSAAQRFQSEIATIRQERDASTASEVAALRQELAAVRASAAAAADTASLRGDLSALMDELRRTRSAVTSPSVRFVPHGPSPCVSSR